MHSTRLQLQNAATHIKTKLTYIPKRVLSYESVKKCPNPTCTCAEMPHGLEIDYKRKLQGSVAPYSEHLLLHTGTADWPSRVEDDERYPWARSIRSIIKNEMVKSLPQRSNNLLFNATSFETKQDLDSMLVTMMKSGYHLHVKESQLSLLIQSVISSKDIKSWIQNQPEIPKAPIDDIIVLICGHGERDSRCGILGPLLKTEFEEKLSRRGFEIQRAPIKFKPELIKSSLTARVGLISHVGGHAFAGNVIIYSSTKSMFSNHGIWYGRVEPKHVEGIVHETILKDIIIEENLRGVV